TLRNIGALLARTGRTDAALATLDSATATFAMVRTHAGSDASAVAYAEQERGSGEDWVSVWLARAVDPSGADPSMRGDARRISAIASALAAAERGRAQGLRDLLGRARSATTATAADALWARDTVPGADLAVEAMLELAPLR